MFQNFVEHVKVRNGDGDRAGVHYRVTKELCHSVFRTPGSLWRVATVNVWQREKTHHCIADLDHHWLKGGDLNPSCSERDRRCLKSRRRKRSFGACVAVRPNHGCQSFSLKGRQQSGKSAQCSKASRSWSSPEYAPCS